MSFDELSAFEYFSEKITANKPEAPLKLEISPNKLSGKDKKIVMENKEKEEGRKKRNLFRVHKKLIFEYKNLNSLFLKYIEELKGSLSIPLFTEKLYKIELAGAEISIIYQNELLKNKFLILEERKNILIVLNGKKKIKCYPKDVIEFYFEYEGVKYLFIGKNLKINRFVKR